MSEFNQLSIAEQELQLAQRKSEELERQKQTEAEQKRVNEAHEQRKDAAFAANLHREIAAAGLARNPDVDAEDFEAVMRSAFKYEIAEDGTFKIKNQATGQYANAEDALRGWASDPKHSKYFDHNSLRLLQTPPHQLCKSMMTTAMKVRYIQTHGEEAYAKLPYNPPAPEVPASEMTPEVWNKLPVSRKSLLLSQYGSAWLEDVMSMRRRRS